MQTIPFHKNQKYQVSKECGGKEREREIKNKTNSSIKVTNIANAATTNSKAGNDSFFIRKTKNNQVWVGKENREERN